ncbi:MAG TPA: hypothetical protein VIL94_00925 [Acidothermaceae bacterium]
MSTAEVPLRVVHSLGGFDLAAAERAAADFLRALGGEMSNEARARTAPSFGRCLRRTSAAAAVPAGHVSQR